MRRTIPAQGNQNETDREEAGPEKENRESAKQKSQDNQKRETTRRNEMKEANTKSNEEETITIQSENNHHVSRRPRQHKESGENAKGTLRYETETWTWQCAQCERGYAEYDARGAAAHVATHTRANPKIRRQKARRIIQENA